jgi:hypothetical protein
MSKIIYTDEEIYNRIKECRSIGQTERTWSSENRIKSTTFSKWI